MDPESGSALKQMQIHNTESGVQNSKYIESQNFESMFLDVHSVHSDWYYPFNYEQARMTSLVLGIEQIVGLVQILDEHKQPVSVVARARICKR